MILLNGFFPGMNFGDDIFLAIAKNKLFTEEDGCKIRRLERSNKNYFSWLYYLTKVKEYYWLGGTFIDKDTKPSMAISLFIEFFLCWLFGARIKLCGVGFSPNLPFMYQWVQSFIIKVSCDVEVRDKISYEFSKNYKFDTVLGEDLCVKYFAVVSSEIARKSVRNNVYVSMDKLESLDLAKKICSTLKNTTNVVYQVTSPYVEEKQIEISKAVCDMISPNSIGIPYESYISVLENLASSDLILTDRLHVAICASMLGVKVYLFPVSDKLNLIKAMLEKKYQNNIYMIGVDL